MRDISLAQMDPQLWQQPTVIPSLEIRRAGPQDASQIHEMHTRLSAESLYFRYLRPYKPQMDEARRMASIKADEGLSLVAVLHTEQSQIVGAAHYVLDAHDPSIAEPAVVVEDDWQGQGIGKMLLTALAQEAALRGVGRFRAAVHPFNVRILHLATHNPQSAAVHWEDGLMIVEQRLEMVSHSS